MAKPICDIACTADPTGTFSCPPCATPTTTLECQPGAACNTDADCNPDLACADATCQPRNGKSCSSDAECGPNYLCNLQTYCGGSGTGGSAGAGGSSGTKWATGAGAGAPGTATIGGGDITTKTGAPGTTASGTRMTGTGGSAPSGTTTIIDTPIETTCTTVTVGWCAPVTITCEGSDACPANWTCEQTNSVGCASAVRMDDGGYVTEPCDAGPQPPKQCVSPYGSYGMGGSGGATLGGGGAGAYPVSGAGGGTATGTDDDTAPRGANGSSTDSLDSSGGTTTHGCQVGTPGPDNRGWVSALAFVGMALAFHRKLRRRSA